MAINTSELQNQDGLSPIDALLLTSYGIGRYKTNGIWYTENGYPVEVAANWHIPAGPSESSIEKQKELNWGKTRKELRESMPILVKSLKEAGIISDSTADNNSGAEPDKSFEL